MSLQNFADIGKIFYNFAKMCKMFKMTSYRSLLSRGLCSVEAVGRVVGVRVPAGFVGIEQPENGLGSLALKMAYQQNRQKI